MDAGDTAKQYAAGFTAGIATVITGHPFDTVKVKLQAHNTQTQVKEYRNALHCARQILSTEGVRGLYKGASSSFIGMAFESSLFFGIYSQTKQFLQGEARSSKPQLQAIIPSGAWAGAIISFILGPSELVKIKGMFRGGVTTLLRESIGCAVFFATYESSRYFIHSNLSPAEGPVQKHLQDVGIGIITGGVSGMTFWAAVLPLDVAKTLIQTSPDAKTGRNPLQTLSSIYRRVGLRGCYAGLGPTLLRAFPANSAAIVAWELTAKILGVKRD